MHKKIFFKSQTNTQSIFFQKNLINPLLAKRNISVETKTYTSHNGSLVEDFVLTNPESHNRQLAFNVINKLMSKQNAVYILTQPSRFLRKQGIKFVPVTINRIEDLFILREEKHKLLPDPGHICAALTDNHGLIKGDLSFRPDNKSDAIANVETALHATVYDSQSSYLKHSSFIPFISEVEEFCRAIERDHSGLLYLTIITGTKITTKLSSICTAFENIKDTNNSFYLAVYNLCTSFIKVHDLQNLQPHNDQRVTRDIEHLIGVAEKLPQIAKFNLKGRRRIAAQACGHALAKVFLQDAHALEKQLGLDLTTQHYAAYLTATIIEDNNYLNETPLLDAAADTIQQLNLNHSKSLNNT